MNPIIYFASFNYTLVEKQKTTHFSTNNCIYTSNSIHIIQLIFVKLSMVDLLYILTSHFDFGLSFLSWCGTEHSITELEDPSHT